jgi:Carbohydrate binding domain
MKKSVKLIMLTTTALTGCFVLAGRAGVRVLPETPATPTVPGELLSNSGFENPAIDVGSQTAVRPDDWLTFTSSRSDLIVVSNAAAHSGNQAVRFEALSVPSFYHGLSQAVPVTRGAVYQFSAYVKSDPSYPLRGTVTGQLSIEWYDANDNEIGRRDWGTTWGASLSSKEWTKVEVSGVAPVNSARAHFVIVEKGGGQPVGGCLFFVDDASVKRESE